MDEEFSHPLPKFSSTSVVWLEKEKLWKNPLSLAWLVDTLCDINFLNRGENSKFIFSWMRNFLALGDEEEKINSPGFSFMSYHKDLFFISPTSEKRKRI